MSTYGYRSIRADCRAQLLAADWVEGGPRFEARLEEMVRDTLQRRSDFAASQAERTQRLIDQSHPASARSNYVEEPSYQPTGAWAGVGTGDRGEARSLAISRAEFERSRIEHYEAGRKRQLKVMKIAIAVALAASAVLTAALVDFNARPELPAAVSK